MASSSRRRTGGARIARDQPVPVVGPREPCPCGSGRRYKVCHGRGGRRPGRLVRRPFEGLPGEADWVALREIVPAATAPLTLRAEFAPAGDASVMAATVLPLAWPGLHRADGQVWVGLQAAGASGDPSRDLADALLRAIAAEPGTPVPPVDLAGPGPRLQDLLEPGGPLEVTVHEGFDFWVADRKTPSSTPRSRPPSSGPTPPSSHGPAHVRRRGVLVPDRRPHPPALGHAVRRGPAAGRAVPAACGGCLADGRGRPVRRGVPRARPAGAGMGPEPGAGAADVEAPAAAFEVAVQEAMARTEPLTAEERRARAGVVHRQVTLR